MGIWYSECRSGGHLVNCQTKPYLIRRLDCPPTAHQMYFQILLSMYVICDICLAIIFSSVKKEV